MSVPLLPAAALRQRMRQAMAQDDWAAAEALATPWLAAGGRDWQVRLNLAVCRSRLRQGQDGANLALGHEALAESQQHPTALLGLAELCIDAGQWEQGLELLDALPAELVAQPSWPAVQLQARALARLGRSGAARQALATIPPAARHWPWALSLADVWIQDCHWEPAERLLRQVLQRHPRLAPAHQNLALVLLSQRRCLEAWPHYEWRRSNPRLDPQGCPRPLPALEQLQGQRLLVLGEQGVGDQLMACRYLRPLAAVAGQLEVQPAPRLVPLLRRQLPPTIGVAPPQDAPEGSDELMLVLGMASLPLLFWSSLGPASDGEAGYLQADPQRLAAWRQRLQRLGPGRCLGLGWLGGLQGSDRRERSLTPADRQGLTQLPGIHWIDLQYLGPDPQPAASEGSPRASHNPAPAAELLAPMAGIHRFGAVGHDLEDTLALMACLDGVVTTRQTVAHLAGALGLGGQVLVPARPEWRYLGDQGRWAWYPSLELLAQRQRGSWSAELETVRQRWCQAGG